MGVGVGRAGGRRPRQPGLQCGSTVAPLDPGAPD
jgi:hypothetical protein